MEAQRFPGEYNGMIVGAAATPRPLLNAWQLSLAQAALAEPAAFIPPAKYPVIHRAVVDACDALDGLKDGLINDPPKCRFDPALLACRGEDGPTCLTARQVETVRTLMRPLRKPGTEVEMFPGWEAGSELSWGAVIAGPEPASITIDHYRYVVFKNPSWDRSAPIHRVPDTREPEAPMMRRISSARPPRTASGRRCLSIRFGCVRAGLAVA